MGMRRLREDYEQAMVRAIGRNNRHATWTVKDVVQSMIQAVMSQETRINIAFVCKQCDPYKCPKGSLFEPRNRPYVCCKNRMFF